MTRLSPLPLTLSLPLVLLACDGTDIQPESVRQVSQQAAEDCDRDYDGFQSIECGGDDCNDNEPSAYPGNEEVCDAEGLDEDCDPLTVGSIRLRSDTAGDKDRDGFYDDVCFNVSHETGEETARGTDCNREKSGVNPGAVESCNGIDDDCDGEIDNIPQCEVLAELTGISCNNEFFPDSDGDGHGNPSGTPVSGCITPAGYSALGNDCDDSNPAIQPGAIVCGESFEAASVCTSQGTLSPVACPGGCIAEANGTGRCAAPGQSCWDNAELTCGSLGCGASGAECHRNGYNEGCAAQCEAIFQCFQSNACEGPCANTCGAIANQNGGIGGTAWRTAATLTQCACQ